MKCKKIVSLILAMAFCLQPVFAVATTMPTKYDSVASIRNEEAKYGEQTQISVDQQASKVTENKVSVKQTFTPQAEATAAMLIQQTVQENWAIDPTTFKITAATEAIVSEVALTTAEPQLAYFLSSEGRYLQVRGAKQALILTYDVIFSGEVASETAKLFTAQTLSVGEASDQFLALAPEVTYATQALETTVPETAPETVPETVPEITVPETTGDDQAQTLEQPEVYATELPNKQEVTVAADNYKYTTEVTQVNNYTFDVSITVTNLLDEVRGGGKTQITIYYNNTHFIASNIDPATAATGTNHSITDGKIQTDASSMQKKQAKTVKFRLEAKPSAANGQDLNIFQSEFLKFNTGSKVVSFPTTNVAVQVDPLGTIPVGYNQTVEEIATNTFQVTLTATNNLPASITGGVLNLDIFGNKFDVIANGGATISTAAIDEQPNGINYANTKLTWSGITLATGATMTHTFTIKVKDDVKLGIGENNIYNLFMDSEPQLAFTYKGAPATLSYGYITAPISYENSNTALCPIPELKVPELALAKTAEKVEGSDNLYDLTLSVDGDPTKTKDDLIDIVLVIDRSGSMYTDAPQLKDALNYFVDTLITEGEENIRIAVTSYGTTAITHSGFTSNQDELLAAVADIPYTANGTLLVKDEAYTTINSRGEKYTVGKPYQEIVNGVTKTYVKLTTLLSGVTSEYVMPVWPNRYGNQVISVHEDITGDYRRSFFQQTNTEVGLMEADALLAAVETEDPCREKQIILFSDGEPNYYQDLNNNIQGNSDDSDATARYPATREAKSQYEIISQKYQNLTTQSVGFFSTDSNGNGFDFMYYVQDKVHGPQKYYDNNFTDKASELYPIFEAIATELKGSTYYDVAKDMIVSDIVTPQFILASDPNFRYTGLTPTTVTIADPKVECDNVDTGLKEQCDQLTFDYAGQMLTTEGATITFTIQVKNEYYGKTAVDTNVRAAVEAWNNPFTDEPDPQAPLEFEVPNVDIPLITGKISVLKAIADNAAVPDAIKFDFFVNGQGDLIPGEATTADSVANTQAYNFVVNANQWQSMNFYLQGSETDTQPNTDYSLGYVTAGTFTLSERVPQNFLLTSIEYCYDTDATVGDDADVCKDAANWQTLTSQGFDVNKDQRYVQLKVTNTISNFNWWFDSVRVNNNFGLKSPNQ
ncbi:MAG: vWA domain-containing protein [Culicoidibacterales bacterium]